MFKITFKLSSQISFIDRPCFDAIVAYAWVKEEFGSVQARLSIPKEEQIDFTRVLPLDVHEKGYFLASHMHFDGNCAVEQTGSSKRQWENKYDHLADFKKSARKIDVSRGEFKSYDLPVNLVSTPEVWFFFYSEDPSRVEYLIDKHILYLGKKRSQGYGEISSSEIIEVPDAKIIRPIPKRFYDTSLPIPPGQERFCAWKPPYWMQDNFEMCIIENQ